LVLERILPAVVRQHPLARRASQRFDVAVVQIAYRLRQQFAIGTRSGDTHLIADQFGDRGGMHAHHGPTAGHGFEHHQPEGLGGARVHQCIGRGQHACQFAAVAVIRDHRDVCGRPLRFAATDQQQVITRAQSLEGVM